MKCFSLALQTVCRLFVARIRQPILLVVIMLLVQTSCEKPFGEGLRSNEADQSKHPEQEQVLLEDAHESSAEQQELIIEAAPPAPREADTVQTGNNGEMTDSDTDIEAEEKEETPVILEWRTSRRISQMTDAGISAIPAETVVTVQELGAGKVRVEYKSLSLVTEADSVYQAEVTPAEAGQDLSPVSRDLSSPKMNTAGDGSKSIPGMQQELAVLRSELQSSMTSQAATMRNYTSKLSQLQRELRESVRRDRSAKEKGRTLAKGGKSNETWELEAKVREAEAFIASLRTQHHESVAELQKKIAVLEPQLSAAQVEAMLERKEQKDREERQQGEN